MLLLNGTISVYYARFELYTHIQTFFPSPCLIIFYHPCTETGNWVKLYTILVCEKKQQNTEKNQYSSRSLFHYYYYARVLYIFIRMSFHPLWKIQLIFPNVKNI